MRRLAQVERANATEKQVGDSEVEQAPGHVDR
jgi:hypothetical protein